MTGERTATVVGGGIAGLAAAASLVRAGWQVTVLERAPEFGEVGAGLAVTRNGMAALDALGIGDRVRGLGHETFAAGTQDRHGRWLLRLPDPRGDPGSANRAWGVHRQRLHGALLAAAADADLVTGAPVLRVRPGEPGGEPAAVTWRDDGGEHTRTADLLVAADGIRSTVRAQLFPGARVAYGGGTSWRAVVERPGGTGEGFLALWGPGAEFGTVPISDTEVYWYGYVHSPAGVRFDDELAAAVEHFSGWSPHVRSVLAATRPDRLMRHDVHHLPGGLPGYVRGRTVVIGDAAHAMLPTMGQGANTSLEDGVCVGRLVAGPVAAGAPLAGALAAFDRARRPRCRRIARRSLQTARLGAHLGGGWRQAARDAVLRRVPAGLLVEAGTTALRWTPPATTAP
ncbi:2-polyprenyl-6-methoxyphenol hydroxylase-like FAD-dependent oxidoreductase [Geodermatophilus tzadiensis]|uniref:2-polyprenyl-6-methoxyphenol hydroxylase-like FAD-dependent oxidoreductase n=1 Tax=Geodermatophilus tzadiensis TaxID=1137988 RepID=A0A2T0T679_9ACTN|nr:FAD-dependent oxidoreductase [Geodermatophilus tzadiensis]PRY41159.1 2-polyprenyl-6-methoxyphenol hydroxylase-like FAD-dependent oxidoreductase [Geodermatophilus tzadiensis]